jgi:hypothetical protein
MPPTYLRSRTKLRLVVPNLPGVLAKVAVGLEDYWSLHALPFLHAVITMKHVSYFMTLLVIIW